MSADGVDNPGSRQQRDRPARQCQAAAGVAADAAGACHRDADRAVEHSTSEAIPGNHVRTTGAWRQRAGQNVGRRSAGKPHRERMPAAPDGRSDVTWLPLSTIPPGHETACRSRRKPRRPDPLSFGDARRGRRARRARSDAEAARLFGRAAGLFRGRHARHRKPLCPPVRQWQASDVCRPHRRRAGRRRGSVDASALLGRHLRRPDVWPRRRRHEGRHRLLRRRGRTPHRQAWHDQGIGLVPDHRRRGRPGDQRHGKTARMGGGEGRRLGRGDRRRADQSGSRSAT